ncbi:gp69 [Alphaproteobacteria phage PhiJL001]|uniref:Gp69 n=1 Tax=Alphaproteobacteria phage PhiJL001 TaxID=2681607 RepID=Q5DN36_9CAUD|nr:gp69 [Alphaproteobacteria phage PhiJL001]AAT69545.1 gp69 [Alphaproteobacteria phage PhiJL001]
MEIVEALAKLDHKNDDHWTQDGLPRIEVVANISGIKDLKRGQITDAAPDFVRVGDDTPPTDDQGQPNPASSDPDDEDVGEIESIDDLTDEEILEASVEDLMRSPELADRWQVVVGNILAQWAKDKNAIENKISTLARRADFIYKVRKQQRKAQPNRDLDGVKAVLQRSKEARAKKHARAKAFLESGTTSEDVVTALSLKAPIDAALNQRKPKLGSTRPAMGMPVRK